jgi:hypothetical protein
MKLMTSKAAVEAPEPGRRERQRLAREERSAEAMAAAERRSVKGRAVTLTERIKAAQQKLDRPLARARELLDDLSDNDLQVYLLAEELDKNRKGVLQGYPAAGAALRAQYEQESGPTPQAADSKE